MTEMKKNERDDKSFLEVEKDNIYLMMFPGNDGVFDLD